MAELVIATRNAGKLSEIQSLLADTTAQVTSLADWAAFAEPEEDGATFEANARLKAVVTARALGVTALADDSGLVVDHLDGRPGVHSARFGGPGLSDAERCQLVLAELATAGHAASPAHFACVMALADPAGRCVTRLGIWPGTVCGPPRGEHGFGYDPIFVPDGHLVTSAELSPDLKNAISHRANALERMQPVLAAWLAGTLWEGFADAS